MRAHRRPPALAVVVRLAAVAALAGLSACRPSTDVEVDGWTVARAALVDGQSCYAQRPQYCITEPGFVDAAIDRALAGNRWEGEMPTMSRDVDQVVRSARVHYESASATAEGLTQIEALVARYYAAPEIDATSDPEVVNVDLGALPGTLAVQGRTPEIVLRESPLIEDFRWQGAEAGRVLGKVALAHPDKPIVRVELLIPKGSSSRPLVYRYFRAQNRIAFGERLERSLYVSEPVEGGPEAMAAGQLDLRRNDVRLCTASGSSHQDSNRWCPIDDAYGQRAREAGRRAARQTELQR